jgi:nucleotide-binding universal stress UspA family protein
MTILVAYPTNRRAKGVLSLAGMLARSTGQDLVVCTALPMPWVPGIDRDDPGFRAYIDELADNAHNQARHDMPTDATATYTTVYARSTPSGLLEAAEQHNASMIVVGSAMGMIEHVTMSSIADRLLHSAPIPVAISTRGFRAAGAPVKRVTLAYTGGSQSGLLVAAAQTMADQLGAQLRLAAFAVRLSPPETAKFRTESDGVIAEWTRNIHSSAEQVVAADNAVGRTAPEIVIGHGADWEDALDAIDWEPGDLLVIGSSESGPVARVFVGSRATKILRNTPVPVIAVPRVATVDLAAQ